MNDIYEEYERWWINELDSYHQMGFWERLRIDETRGTNIKDISVIINKIENLLKTYYGKPFERINSASQIVTPPIDFSNDNVFLNDLTLVLRPYINGSNTKIAGSYKQSISKYDEKCDKLCNNVITLFGEDRMKFVADKETLYETLWHELQHAYRQYGILKQNYENDVGYDYKTKYYNQAYFNGVDYCQNYGGNWVTMRQMLYVSDINEIDSKMQEMIPYIDKHKEINFANYKKYLNNIPSYIFLKGFKSLLEACEYYYHNKLGRENMGIMLYNIYMDNPKYSKLNWTYEHYAKVLYNRMRKNYLYAENKFYKILYYTLDEFGRRNIGETMMHTEPHTYIKEMTIEEHQKELEDMIKEIIPLNKLITV